MQIVLLCGGLGRRIREIDKFNPKGMIDINNKPFFDYLLKSLKPHNFSNLHFCFGYKSEIYLSHLKENYAHLNYTYSLENENELLGTGGAIKNCIDLLDQNFIIQYGDTILKLNYEKFFKLHLQNNKLMTMSILNSSKSEEAPNLYCYEKSEGEITCVYNKKNPHKYANFIDYGALVFNKQTFQMINRRIFDLSDLQEEFTLKNKSNFYIVDNKYIEIGTPSSLEKAKLELDDF
tara:strand:+ start:527 stop:1228 length:702 start_codon:yes stop_codon:yes gene_type:complete